MGTTTMGKVFVEAKIENLADLLKVQEGRLKPRQVRRVKVTDAVADTGAYNLCLPARLIAKLGISQAGRKRMRGTTGIAEARVFGPVRLTVQGRDCTVDVLELPNDCPVLIGQIPLEIMDWVVDPKGGKLVGNPEHGGEWMWEVF